MLFCLKEHNSVVFISCADTVKFRLSVLCSSYPGPFDTWASSVSYLLFCTRDHSQEHPPIHDHLLMGFHTHSHCGWADDSPGTLTHESLAPIETPALAPPGPRAAWIPLDRAEDWHPHTCPGTHRQPGSGRQPRQVLRPAASPGHLGVPMVPRHRAMCHGHSPMAPCLCLGSTPCLPVRKPLTQYLNTAISIHIKYLWNHSTP